MQPIKSFSKNFSLANFNHEHIVAMWLHVVNENFYALFRPNMY